jgi:hypothetical protein
MSAFICDPSHIGLLAAYATDFNCVLGRWKSPERIETAQRIALELTDENIRSVMFRYPDDKDGERPGRGLKDAEIVELAQHYAAHFITHPIDTPSVQILKMAMCLEYQSCETGDWYHSLAFRQLALIKDRAIGELPGYDRAPWEWIHPIEEIESLVTAE